MIRLASPADLPAIADIYDAILTREESGGPVYTNWQRGKYPTMDTARQALGDGTLYVGEDVGSLWGVVNLNAVQLPEYDDIPWTIPAERERVGVIHTLCIPPCHAGRGLGRQMVQYAKQHAAAMGCTVIRLDTWAGNTPAARLYQTNGFSLCGRAEVLFQGRIPEELIFLEYQI